MCESSIISQILEFIYWTVMIFIFDGVTVQTENIRGNSSTSFPGPFPWTRPQTREKALGTRLEAAVSCTGGLVILRRLIVNCNSVSSILKIKIQQCWSMNLDWYKVVSHSTYRFITIASARELQSQTKVLGHEASSPLRPLIMLISRRFFPFLLERKRYFPKLIRRDVIYVIQFKCPNYLWPEL